MEGAERELLEGHRERLRNRLDREGWSALKPHEMIELVLGQVQPRQDLGGVSRRLISSLGSLGEVFAATREQLLAVPGMTNNMAEWILITGRLIRCYRRVQGVGLIRLESYRKVTEFLSGRLEALRGFSLWVLFADFDFNLIAIEDLRENPVWWEAENVRRLVGDAIGYGAKYLYLVLWRSNPEQGMDGMDSARLDAITSVLNAAELELVDCLLVNEHRSYSMRVHGKMNASGRFAGDDALCERYGAPE